MIGIRAVLLSLILSMVLFATSCGSKPSVPPVGANLDLKATANELAALAGTWVYERQIVEGSEIPIADLHKDSIVISGNSLVRNVFRADGQPLMPVKSTLHIDPTVDPKQMDEDVDLVIRTSRRLGIYKLEEDRLTLCYDNTGKQRPTVFDSPAESSFVLTVLRRQGK